MGVGSIHLRQQICQVLAVSIKYYYLISFKMVLTAQLSVKYVKLITK